RKTAYDIETWLEFRRVLFRSGSWRRVWCFDLHSRQVFSEVHDLRLWPGRRQLKHSLLARARDFRSAGLIEALHVDVKCCSPQKRSEERRVGKECMSRGVVGEG